MFSRFVEQSNQNLSSRIKFWIRKNLVVFAFAFLFSIGFHAVLFSFFSFLSTSQALNPTNPDKKLKSLNQSLHQMHEYYAERNLSPPPQKTNKSQIKKPKGVEKKLPQKSPLPEVNPSSPLPQKERENSLPSLPKKDYTARAKRIRQTPFLAGSRQVRIPTQQGSRYVPAGYFFRDSPYKKIISSGAELFSIIQGFPELNEDSPIQNSPQEFLPLRKEILHQNSIDEMFSEPGKNFPEFNEMPSFPSSLVIADENSQQIMDQLMPLSEKKQWNQFESTYLKSHNPNSPQLARLTRQFIHQNLTNAFIAINDISAAFDSVEEIYFNNELDREFYQYWKKHPQSETGAVFLLTLAAHYHFERRALAHLFKAYGEAQKFLTQKDTREDLYEKEMKSRVVKRICEDLIKRLKKEGYSSLQGVLHKYKQEETKIYSYLLKMEGKGRNWGLFALGCFEWEEGYHKTALNHWQKIEDPSPSNQALQEIREVLSRQKSSPLEKIIPKVESIMDYHSQKNSRALLLRLVKFGEWKNRNKQP